MAILITGGNGYIGSHIAKLLHDQANNIIIIDKQPDKTFESFGLFVCVDITNSNDLDLFVFSKYKISSIIHLAGKAFVSESCTHITDYYNTNVVGTVNILNMMVKYNIKNIVFSSSCAVYGNANILPITEETPLNPLSPYGLTKKICEDMIINYSKVKNIKYVILRYFNVAGNDFECIAHDNEKNYNRLIPTIILKSLRNETVLVNGNTYNTRDGTCVRNYIHVLDLANAHVKALLYILQNDTKQLLCNLGCDENYSILEIINIVEEHMSKKITYEFCNKINGDPDIVYCDNNLAKNILNIEIKYTIHDIVKSYINYLQKVK